MRHGRCNANPFDQSTQCDGWQWRSIPTACRDVSPQAESLQVVEERLQAGGIPFVKQTVTEDGLRVHQVPSPSPCVRARAIVLMSCQLF